MLVRTASHDPAWSRDVFYWPHAPVTTFWVCWADYDILNESIFTRLFFHVTTRNAMSPGWFAPGQHHSRTYPQAPASVIRPRHFPSAGLNSWLPADLCANFTGSGRLLLVTSVTAHAPPYYWVLSLVSEHAPPTRTCCDWLTFACNLAVAQRPAWKRKLRRAVPPAWLSSADARNTDVSKADQTPMKERPHPGSLPCARLPGSPPPETWGGKSGHTWDTW